MRFDVFYFDNGIDPEHFHNPRNILTEKAWPVLQLVSEWPIDEDISARCDMQQVNDMIAAGALRWEESDLRFDTPIFLEKDATILNGLFAQEARNLANCLIEHRQKLYSLAGLIKNGFGPLENLYHILCGMVFDGTFFDSLCETGCVATSRIHPSGMDYITIIYEQCEELDALSSRLLCSWNRLVGKDIALQSFGDSDGTRHDFYRAYQSESQAGRNGDERECRFLPPKDAVLEQTRLLIENGTCDAWAVRLLEAYGYACEGHICVPVFRAEDEPVVREISEFVGNVLLEHVKDLLLNCKLDITATRHGVDRREIANELYHILFGQINEEIVKAKLVTSPHEFQGEGRYLKSIQLFS